MRTVICALDWTDARRAAREHGIRPADMLVPDRTGRHVRGLSEFRVLVTDRFARRRDAAEITWYVRDRAMRMNPPLDIPVRPNPGMYEPATAAT